MAQAEEQRAGLTKGCRLVFSPNSQQPELNPPQQQRLQNQKPFHFNMTGDPSIDSLVYQPGQKTSSTSTVPAQQEEMVSFDDPRFVNYLSQQHSPEAAEQAWANAVGWNRVSAGIDREILAMKAANPKLPGNLFTSIAESRKAELKAQAPGLAALEQAKQKLNTRMEAAKGTQSKFNGEQWAHYADLIGKGVSPFEATQETVSKVPFTSGESADPLKGYIGGSGGASVSGDNSAKSDYNIFSMTIDEYLALDQAAREKFVNGDVDQKQVTPVEQGNIDLTTRPVVSNPDGTISTIRSKSFNFDGQEVLLPTISDDGRGMTDDETVQQYLSTGKHLGKFSTPEEATTFAQELSRQQGENKAMGSLNYRPVRFPDEVQAEQAKEKPGYLTQFKNDFARDIDGLQMMTGGLLATAGKATGNLGAYSVGRDMLEANAALYLGGSEKKMDEYELLQQAHDQGVGFLFGLVLGVVFLLLVRPKGKSKFPKQVAFRLMAWGLILVIAMETSRFWVKGDFVAFIDAILRTSINAGLLWVIGYGFGWVKFYLIRRKKDGPSGAALTREEFSVANSSANQGDPQAQYQLALCYFHGQGVVKNTIEAYKWVLLAQAGGLSEARRLCDKIEKNLSRTEIAHGQHMASEFRKAES